MSLYHTSLIQIISYLSLHSLFQGLDQAFNYITINSGFVNWLHSDTNTNHF